MKMFRTENILNCVYCDKPGKQVYENLKDLLGNVGGAFGVKRCPECSLLWLDPRPIPEDIRQCYNCPDDQVLAGVAKQESSRRMLAGLRNTLRDIILCGYFGERSIHANHQLCGIGKILGSIPWLRRRATLDAGWFFPRVSRDTQGLFIDVGCGKGDYLFWLQKLGWKTIGIEPYPAYADVAEAKGISVVRKGILEARLPDECAQYVSMAHVIEHCLDPLQAVNECWRMLKTGGKLIIRTPNALSRGHSVFKQYWYWLDPPRHVFIFSPQSLRHLFEKTRFRKISLTSAAVITGRIYNLGIALERGEWGGYGNAKKSFGRHWFSLEERLRLFAGQAVGEELQLVATK